MVNDVNIHRNSDGQLLWFLKEHCCYQAATVLGAIDENGKTCGDEEFSISKEQLSQFKNDIVTCDLCDDIDTPAWILEKMSQLQIIIDTFDFENDTLMVTTDW